MRMPDLNEATLAVERFSDLISIQCDSIKLIENLGAPGREKIILEFRCGLRRSLAKSVLVSSLILDELQPYIKRLSRESSIDYQKLMVALMRADAVRAQASKVHYDFDEEGKARSQADEHEVNFIVMKEVPP